VIGLTVYATFLFCGCDQISKEVRPANSLLVARYERHWPDNGSPPVISNAIEKDIRRWKRATKYLRAGSMRTLSKLGLRATLGYLLVAGTQVPEPLVVCRASRASPYFGTLRLWQVQVQV
jgi:hypothetical protein